MIAPALIAVEESSFKPPNRSTNYRLKSDDSYIHAKQPLAEYAPTPTYLRYKVYRLCQKPNETVCIFGGNGRATDYIGDQNLITLEILGS